MLLLAMYESVYFIIRHLFYFTFAFKILDEAGMEGNDAISEADFQLIIKKLPDFATSFKLLV